jgi:hypothetical protein
MSRQPVSIKKNIWNTQNMQNWIIGNKNKNIDDCVNMLNRTIDIFCDCLIMSQVRSIMLLLRITPNKIDIYRILINLLFCDNGIEVFNSLPTYFHSFEMTEYLDIINDIILDFNLEDNINIYDLEKNVKIVNFLIKFGMDEIRGEYINIYSFKPKDMLFILEFFRMVILQYDDDEFKLLESIFDRLCVFEDRPNRNRNTYSESKIKYVSHPLIKFFKFLRYLKATSTDILLIEEFFKIIIYKHYNPLNYNSHYKINFNDWGLLSDWVQCSNNIVLFDLWRIEKIQQFSIMDNWHIDLNIDISDWNLGFDATFTDIDIIFSERAHGDKLFVHRIMEIMKESKLYDFVNYFEEFYITMTFNNSIILTFSTMGKKIISVSITAYFSRPDSSDEMDPERIYNINVGKNKLEEFTIVSILSMMSCKKERMEYLLNLKLDKIVAIGLYKLLLELNYIEFSEDLSESIALKNFESIHNKLHLLKLFCNGKNSIKGFSEMRWSYGWNRNCGYTKSESNLTEYENVIYIIDIIILFLSSDYNGHIESLSTFLSVNNNFEQDPEYFFLFSLALKTPILFILYNIEDLFLHITNNKMNETNRSNVSYISKAIVGDNADIDWGLIYDFNYKQMNKSERKDFRNEYFYNQWLITHGLSLTDVKKYLYLIENEDDCGEEAHNIYCSDSDIDNLSFLQICQLLRTCPKWMEESFFNDTENKMLVESLQTEYFNVFIDALKVFLS